MRLKIILINCIVAKIFRHSKKTPINPKEVNSLNKENWSYHRDTLREQFYSFGSGPDVLISNPSGSVVISHSSFAPYQGEGHAIPYTILGLCTAGGGRTRRESEQICLDDEWRPGRAGLVMPGPAARGFTPRMEMLTIAFGLNDIPACHGQTTTAEDLQTAAGQLIDDELVSAVMVALLRNAEAHGAASAFFDHGLSLILQRLVARANDSTTRSLAHRSRQFPLDSTFELIESRLGDDLRVKEMADRAGLDTRTLTRQFKLETGYTPYQYLTRRRMAWAKTLLKEGMSVTDTAGTVGYANPAKFSAAFRRWVGMTPSCWKRRN